MLSLERPSQRPYLMALSVVAAALGIRALLDPLLGPQLPFYLFYFAVLVASFSGGLGPGLAALVVSFISAAYFFVMPRFSLAMAGTEDLWGAFRFISLGLVLALCGNWASTLRAQWKLDVQAVRRKEEAARKAQEETLNTLASIGDGVITTDTQGRITFMNALAAQLSAWDPARAKGRSITDIFRIVNGTSREVVPDPMLAALREERVVTLPQGTVLIAKDGSERTVDDSAAPIRDAQGVITGSVLVFREVTARSAALARGFQVGEIQLYPAPGSHAYVAQKELERLETACRLWLEREWQLDTKASRIVGLAGFNVTIQQDTTQALPDGGVCVRFLAAYSD